MRRVSLALISGQVSDAGRDWISGANVVMSKELHYSEMHVKLANTLRQQYR